MKQLFFILILLSILSCGREQGNLLETIDIEKAIDNSESFDIRMHVTNIRYIPLETSENCLIAEIRKIVRNEDYILVSDSNKSLFLFSSQGQFIRKIGEEGRAPYEYVNMTDFVVDATFANIYINTIGSLVNYAIDGEFMSKVSLDLGNLQVLCIDNNNRLFYMMPASIQENGEEYFDLIYVYDVNGQLLKTFKSNLFRAKGSLAFFNGIYAKNDEVFYKEEFGDYIFRIDSDLKKDSAFQIDLGKYAFEPEDFERSKRNIWENHYRLSTMFSFESYVFFNMQKGLIGNHIEPIIYDRRKQKLIYPHSKVDPRMKGIYLDGAKLTPIADFNDELVCLISTEDIMENRDALTGDLKYVSTQINENSNPVLAILELKKK